MQFSDLRLAQPILRALEQEKYLTATPIQAQAIPHLLEGHDVLGIAQTGTGKTAAFALPMLDRLSRGAKSKPTAPRALVLAPTRELALQIAEGFDAYGRNIDIRITTIFGGVSQHRQTDALRRGVDVVIATPGRLLDLIGQQLIRLDQVQMFVLDEADRMFDMGFINDVKRIAAHLPAKRQAMMFSATMPREVRELVRQLLHDPKIVEVARVSQTADNVEELLYHVDKADKVQLLAYLYEQMPITRGIVFTRTKHGADRIVRQLHRMGIPSQAIHGNKSQNARERAMKQFKTGKTPLLIATDIASRGIDVDDVSHVINYDITHEPETHVHRIGRTARAGASGVAVSLCSEDEKSFLHAIERLTRRKIRVVKIDADVMKEIRSLGSRDRSAPAHGDFDDSRHARSDRRAQTGHGDRSRRPGDHQPHRRHRADSDQPSAARAPSPHSGGNRPTKSSQAPRHSSHRPDATAHADAPSGQFRHPSHQPQHGRQHQSPQTARPVQQARPAQQPRPNTQAKPGSRPGHHATGNNHPRAAHGKPTSRSSHSRPPSGRSGAGPSGAHPLHRKPKPGKRRPR
jgi:ATP-dependent RNA helicase RhlE